MNIVLQYFDSCPGWRVVDARLRSIVESSGIDADIAYLPIETIEQAEVHGFAGSPTILIDGEDPWADPQHRVGLSCRTYPSAEGLDHWPTQSQLEEALGVGG